MIADVFCEKVLNVIWKADNNYLLVGPSIWYVGRDGARHCLLIIRDGVIYILPPTDYEFLLSDPDCFDKVINLIRELNY